MSTLPPEERVTRESLAEVLNRFPEVKWDRLATAEDFSDNGAVFGWIEREDDHADFVMIEWAAELWIGLSLTTSSARYTREFQRRLHGSDDGHQDCQRVEDVLGALVKNKVELAA